MQSHTLMIAKEANAYFTFGLSFRRQNFIAIDRNMDAVIGFMMVTYEDFAFGLSYDWTISTLGEEKTFGTFEIGLKYIFAGKNLCKHKAGCSFKGFKLGHPVPKFGL